MAVGPEFFGFQFAGLLLNVLLYGVFLTQAYHYWAQYNRTDRMLTKALVLYLILAETANSIVTSAIVFEPLVMYMGKESQSVRVSRFLSCDAVSIVLVSTPVQIFYAWRIYSTTHSKLALAWITFYTIVSTAAAFATTIISLLNPNYNAFLRFRWAVITWLSGAVVADISISACLIRFLRSHKGGFATADTLIDKIIISTVQLGALPCLFALLDVLFFVAGPVQHTGVNFIFDFCLSKLYSNFLLSTLNARAAWNALIDSKRKAPVISFIEMPVSPLQAQAKGPPKIGIQLLV